MYKQKIRMNFILSMLATLLIITYTSNYVIASEVKGMEKELVGIWHVLPMMPSGWADHYHFFKDCHFRFEYNQMDGEKRVMDFSGDWSIRENKLILIVKAKTIIEGGKLIEATGSTATKYEIEDGVIKNIKVKPPQKIIYSISSIKKDYIKPSYENEGYSLPMIKINGRKYWRMYDNPNQ